MPILPPAPTWFSITNCWPNFSVSFWPTSRATTSTGPPAANGTMIRTGLRGILLRGCRSGESQHGERRETADRSGSSIFLMLPAIS